MDGWRGLLGVWPAALVCGVAFAGTQFLVSNFMGPYLTDILSSMAAIVCLALLLRFWKPGGPTTGAEPEARIGATLSAWMPYGLLGLFVVLWGLDPVKNLLNTATVSFGWSGLDNPFRRAASL